MVCPPVWQDEPDAGPEIRNREDARDVIRVLRAREHVALIAGEIRTLRADPAFRAPAAIPRGKVQRPNHDAGDDDSDECAHGVAPLGGGGLLLLEPGRQILVEKLLDDAALLV